MFAPIRLSRAVGGNVLSLPVELSAEWLEAEPKESASVLFTGSVRMENHASRWLGWLIPQVFALRGYRVSEELGLLLSDDQLEAVEERRGGESLDLWVQIDAHDVGGDQPSYPHAQIQAAVRVPSSTWCEQLDQVGAEVCLAIRVPAPFVDVGGVAPAADAATVASRSQASARLRQARDQLRDGATEQCVATCRLVLENLDVLTPPVDAQSVFKKTPRTRSPQERWDVLRHDLASLLSMAHHDDEVTRNLSWNSADAAAVLALVSAMASRIMQT